MSKRNKKSRSNQPAFKLEALEQRQLLAAITAGSGSEVDSDITLANGNTYDQILLTGSTVTVGADAGQVTRIDFLDADGDLVRAEFAGSGTLTISLADFKDAAVPEEYASETKYVQGTASFRIEGSDETTNFSLHSLGSENVHNGLANPIFADGTKDGGNNTANVSRLVIEAQDSAIGSSFGGIRAGNAVFADSSGAVGIVAPDIQFTGPIIIGDIDASGNAVPVIHIGQFSTNKTVTIAGGDLDQTNNVVVDNKNVTNLTSTSGQSSFGALVATKIIDVANINGGIAADDVAYTSAEAKVEIDGATVTQAELDAYKDKFLNDVVIKNGLASGLIFAARLIGNVTVEGDLAGIITTDVDDDNASDGNELGIGDVTITGNIVAKGAIESSTSIGNVSVTGGIDFDDVNNSLNGDALALISTLGRNTASSSIGNVSFGAEVDLDNENVTLIWGSAVGAGSSGGIGNISGTTLIAGGAAATTISSANKGSIGSITFTGDATANAITAEKSIGAITGAEVSLGALTSGDDIGAITSKDGNLTLAAITATDAVGAISADEDLALNGAIAAKTVGAISAGESLTLTGTLTTTGSVGNLTASDGNLNLSGVIDINGGGSLGNILVSKGNLNVNATVSAEGNIGSITVSKGDFTLGADVAADNIGAISVSANDATGGKFEIAAGSQLMATDGSVGAITVSGASGTDNLKNAGIISFGDALSQVSATKGIGDITVNLGYITGFAGSVEFTANTIGNVSVTGRADATFPQEYLLSNVIFQALGTTEATVGSAKIGNITLNSSANADGVIATGAASVSGVTGTGFSSSGSIGNITLTTADEGSILETGAESLVFRAGSDGLGLKEAGSDWSDGVAKNGGVSIGNVTISADLSKALSTGAAGTGLIIASGVNPASNGVFASGAGSVLVGPDKVGSNSTIGAVTLEDLSGTVTSNGFVSATLPGNNFTAGSVIVADKITSVSLATGAGTVLDLTTLNGLPLKGVVAVGADGEASYDGAEGTNLFVVVL